MSEELIVYVGPNGLPTGETAPKLKAHNFNTRLHLAFSCYVFNEEGNLLVTQRAFDKKVWPGVWTNSVCGHPGPGENRLDAVKRRLSKELGMTGTDFRVVLSDYIYKTPPFNGIIEHEYCPVYVARATSPVVPNPDEVEDYSWMPWETFVELVTADTTDRWSWWCRDQIKLLVELPTIAEYSQPKNSQEDPQ